MPRNGAPSSPRWRRSRARSIASSRTSASRRRTSRTSRSRRARPVCRPDGSDSRTADSAVPSRSPAPTPVPFQILVVEDKDSLRTMLRLALESHGYGVLEARDQPEAVQALQRGQPALVLTDLRLPAGDGFGVLRSVKDTDPDLPVVVMTAYGSIQDAVAAMKEGALDFLAKPVDPEHLLLLVERALAQRRMAT